jgi:uncharacterized membrane protein YfcA
MSPLLIAGLLLLVLVTASAFGLYRARQRGALDARAVTGVLAAEVVGGILVLWLISAGF